MSFRNINVSPSKFHFLLNLNSVCSESKIIWKIPMEYSRINLKADQKDLDSKPNDCVKPV